MIDINIEIKKQNRLKEFFHKLHSKSEDILFSIIQKLPDKLIPSALMNWMERYTDKRIAELNQQIIRDRWHTIELEKAVNKIQTRQQSKK